MCKNYGRNVVIIEKEIANFVAYIDNAYAALIDSDRKSYKSHLKYYKRKLCAMF